MNFGVRSLIVAWVLFLIPVYINTVIAKNCTHKPCWYPRSYHAILRRSVVVISPIDTHCLQPTTKLNNGIFPRRGIDAFAFLILSYVPPWNDESFLFYLANHNGSLLAIAKSNTKRDLPDGFEQALSPTEKHPIKTKRFLYLWALCTIVREALISWCKDVGKIPSLQ